MVMVMTKKRFKCVSNYDWWGVIDITGEIKGEYDSDCFSTDTVVDLLNSLSEENKQLKKENYELHKRLGDFEQFEEHIKERTSKTSVNDIIGLVKTDEPTNSVELKKELYK